jgi:hypothetical protein
VASLFIVVHFYYGFALLLLALHDFLNQFILHISELSAFCDLLVTRLDLRHYNWNGQFALFKNGASLLNLSVHVCLSDGQEFVQDYIVDLRPWHIIDCLHIFILHILVTIIGDVSELL